MQKLLTMTAYMFMGRFQFQMSYNKIKPSLFREELLEWTLNYTDVR